MIATNDKAVRPADRFVKRNSPKTLEDYIRLSAGVSRSIISSFWPFFREMAQIFRKNTSLIIPICKLASCVRVIIHVKNSFRNNI